MKALRNFILIVCIYSLIGVFNLPWRILKVLEIDFSLLLFLLIHTIGMTLFAVSIFLIFKRNIRRASVLFLIGCTLSILGVTQNGLSWHFPSPLNIGFMFSSATIDEIRTGAPIYQISFVYFLSLLVGAGLRNRVDWEAEQAR